MAISDERNALRNARRLFGPDWNRRILAAEILGEAGAVEAVADLEAVALENKHPELVKAVICALGKIRNETAVAALENVSKSNIDEMATSLCLKLLCEMKNSGPSTSQAPTTQGDGFGR